MVFGMGLGLWRGIEYSSRMTTTHASQLGNSSISLTFHRSS
jgi:hypothetical protein